MGCVLSSYGEGQFSLVGVGFRSLGIFSEATRLVLTQKLLKQHKLNIIESQARIALGCQPRPPQHTRPHAPIADAPTAPTAYPPRNLINLIII